MQATKPSRLEIHRNYDIFWFVFWQLYPIDTTEKFYQLIDKKKKMLNEKINQMKQEIEDMRNWLKK